MQRGRFRELRSGRFAACVLCRSRGVRPGIRGGISLGIWPGICLVYRWCSARRFSTAQRFCVARCIADFGPPFSRPLLSYRRYSRCLFLATSSLVCTCFASSKLAPPQGCFRAPNFALRSPVQRDLGMSSYDASMRARSLAAAFNVRRRVMRPMRPCRRNGPSPGCVLMRNGHRHIGGVRHQAGSQHEDEK
jgi:hypothetical protein